MRRWMVRVSGELAGYLLVAVALLLALLGNWVVS